MAMNKKIRGLTVEIGGDTTKLGKSLDDSKGRSKNLQKELREVNKLLKGNPNDVELLAQKETLLKQRVEETTKQLDLLKGSQEKINRMFEQGEIGEEDYRAFQREVQRTQQTLDGLQTDLKKTSDHFGQVQRASGEINFKTAEDKVDYLKGKFKDLAQQSADSMKKVSKEVEKSGEKIENVGKKLTPVSAGAAGLLGVGVKLASEFEDEFAFLTTIAKEEGITYDKLKNQIIDLSNDTGIDAAQIARNTYDAISAGQETKNAVAYLRQAIGLSKSGKAEVNNALDILTTITNAYELQADQAGYISDILIQTQNLGKTTVGDLSQYMGKVIPTAKSYNVALNQLGAAYAVMTSKGIATADSTTYLNSLLNELGKSDSKAAKAIKEGTGKTFPELMAEGKTLSEVLAVLETVAKKNGVSFNDLFSKTNAAKAATTLFSGDAGKFNGVLKQMNSATGSTSKALEKLDTSSAKTKKTVNELKNVGIELGSEVLEQAAPLLKDVMGGVKGLTEWIKKLNPEQKQMLIKGIELIAILGPGTTAVGKLTKNVGNIVGIIPKLVTKIISMTSATEGATVAQEGLNLAQSMSPAGALITLITSLVGVMGLLYIAQSDEIKNADLLAGSYSKLYSKIEENKKSYDDMVEARNKVVNDTAAEYGYYDQLREKLDKIVDGSGKVKKGHEEEADTIINTLSKALDIEIKKEGNVIQNYKDLQKELQNTINLKKAEAIQSAYSEDYNKAVKNQTESYTDYQKAVEAAKKAENNLVNAREKLKRMPATGHYEQTTTGRVWKEDKQASLAYEQQKVLIQHYSDAVEKANQKVKDSQSIYLGYVNTISNYENMTAALASGNQQKIADATLRLENNFITAKNGTRDMLEQQVTTYREKYNSMKEAVENGAPGVTQAMVDGAKKMVERSEKELRKLPENTNASLNATADVAHGQGHNVGNAFSAGLKATAKNAEAAGEEVAKAAERGIKSGAQIHSPSKVGLSLGGNLGGSFGAGIKDKGKDVAENAAALAKIATKALGTASADFKLDSLSTPVKAAQAQIIYEHRISQQQAQTAQITAVLGKIDTLIKTVESGKVITLDKKTVIGETAKGYDSAIGEIALRRERGW